MAIEIVGWIQQYPKMSIIIFAALISLFITLINFFFMDKEKLRELKKRQKEIQAEVKEHQKAGNQDKVIELNKEMLAQIPETFKQSLKPMLITIVPILIFFSLIKNVYATTTIASSWFWWYLGTAIVSSMVFRKVFKLP